MSKTLSRKCTKELVVEIRRLLDEGKLYQHQIAAKLGVNQGRVSEVNTGRRTPEYPDGVGEE